MAAGSVVGGRSRPLSHTARSRTTTKKPSAKTRSKIKDEENAPQPSISELRHSRVLYYDAPHNDRSGEAGRENSTDRSKSANADQRRTTETMTKRRTVNLTRSALETRKKIVGEKRVADYVVAVRQAAPAQNDPRSSSPSLGLDMLRNGQHEDCDIVPDDSISMVARRRRSGTHRLSVSNGPSSAKSARPSSAKLGSIKENAAESNTSRAPFDQKSTRRESTLLGSLFRRRSVPAAPTSPKLVSCLTCGADDIPSTKTAKLQCRHRMCHNCLRRIFKLSVTDPAHMPPRCCTSDHIPLKHVEKLFDTKFKIAWNRKYQEYHTQNRIYCPARRCGVWIKPAHVHSSHGRTYAQCPKCALKVCTLCNNKMHKSRECPEDPEIQKLIAHAKEKGWQSCYSCNAIVELKEGCNHMTCRCRAEFCMICGLKWKTCDCPWFSHTRTVDGDRLLDMRIPEPVNEVRRYLGLGRAPLAGARESSERGPVQRARAARPLRSRTFHEDDQQRLQQERDDEALARRIQTEMSLNRDNSPAGAPRRSSAYAQTWGIGNAASHFLNDNFVQNASHVRMSSIGDPAMARRGTRESGRRRQSRLADQGPGDPGLPRNFLGDESVLGYPAGESPARRRY